MCIHDREWKGVKTVNERDRCVGDSTYPEPESQMGYRGRVRDVKTSAGWMDIRDKRVNRGRSKRRGVLVLYITFYNF